MSKTRMRVILAALMIGVSAPVAFAQNAQIMGTVTDASGGVMPGVSVTVRNEATGLVRSEVTDGAGNYRLPALPIPGPYTITAEIQGFVVETREHISLSIDQTARFDFKLAAASVSETVTVSGMSPVVDTTATTPQTALTTQQIQDLPVAARRWIDMAMLTPGTSQDNIRGGNYRGNVSVGAGVTNFFSTRSEVDGVSNNFIGHGEMRQNFPMDAIEQFTVAVASSKAESAMGTGGVVNVVTKSGTNALHLGGFIFHRNRALTAKQYFEEVNPPYRRNQVGGTVGGPVVRDKLHYFVAYERTDEHIYKTVTVPAWPQYNGTHVSKEYSWTYLVRSDYQLSPTRTLFARFAQEYEIRPFISVGGSTVPSASRDQGVPRDSLVLGHTWIVNSQSLFDFRFQSSHAKYEIAPPGSKGSWDPGDFGPNRYEGCSPAFRYPSVSIGGCVNQMGPEHRLEFRTSFSRQMNFGGDHQLKVGFDYSRVPYTHDSANRVDSWTFPLDRPYDPNDPATYPTQYSQSLPIYAKLTSWQYGFFVQDEWRPLPNLTVSLGLRFDDQHCAYGDCLDKQLAETAEVLGPEFRSYPIPVPFIDLEARGKVENIGPRVGFAWVPTSDGRTNVHASWGKHYDFMRIFQCCPNELTWHQSQTIVISRPSYPDPLRGLSRSAFLSTAPPNISVNSNTLRSPYSYPIVVGVSQELRGGLGITADYNYVNRYADVQNIDINLPDQATRQRPYPQFGRVTQQDSVGETTYRALLVKLERRFANGWSGLLSYTLGWARDQPIMNSDGDRYGYFQNDGYSTADRRHVLRLSGTVELPWDSRLSAIVDLRTSQPFSPSTTRDINGDGYTGDRPAGVGFRTGCRGLDLAAVNTYRAASGIAPVDSIDCPGFQNIDLRYSKTFRVSDHRFELIAQLFNVTNHANFATATDNILSPSFGKVNAIQPYINAPSRQAEIAIRFNF